MVNCFQLHKLTDDKYSYDKYSNDLVISVATAYTFMISKIPVQVIYMWVHFDHFTYSVTIPASFD